ncbi:lipopolysaccharide assembly protein LapA domain-containing protein [Sphingomonas canadensis]|uniref:Lipopolysaccharide assembly protein LapA domain-containing protein n=1 Tax=Sphingomonas canadensis TaxID=1219257 RepID=A0ABW3HA02_9SPHN|nr:lipopolysaccharide assembly protein LapA domain-containing protein [Sphingomonas canadensis]MCW3837955.1 lipopolysaccharide assembly protein LapA domain-containing protein [Sphingomonas canadensis]
MRFLKVLFWLLLGGVVTAFVLYNGEQRVSVLLWGGLIADFSLPMLLILLFLAGFLPMLLAYHAMRWRLRQRIAGLQRALEDLRAIHAAAPAPTPVPVPAPEALPAPAGLSPAP